MLGRKLMHPRWQSLGASQTHPRASGFYRRA
jgi:hypothetical protein